MIEVCMFYDMKENYDEQLSVKWLQDFQELMENANGFIELHTFKSIAGSKTRWKQVWHWKSLAAWSTFVESRKYQKFSALSMKFMERERTEIWMEGNPFAPI